MTSKIVIDKRFCGPPNSANGGYAAGMVAGDLQGSIEVTLKAPPPLGQPLLRQQDGATAMLHHGDVEIASARIAPLDILVPPPVTLKRAHEARQRFAEVDPQVFPRCFVCGVERQEGDGMCIHTGPVGERIDGLVAAPWVVDKSLVDAGGAARHEFMWAALDCPGFFAARAAHPELTALLGRFTVEIFARPRAGDECIAMGWFLSAEGRKHHVGTAVYGREGKLLGRAKATWIAFK